MVGGGEAGAVQASKSAISQARTRLGSRGDAPTGRARVAPVGGAWGAGGVVPGASGHGAGR